MDVEYFPFDEQTCVMKFGSWTYDGFQVKIMIVVMMVKELVFGPPDFANLWKPLNRNGIIVGKFGCTWIPTSSSCSSERKKGFLNFLGSEYFAQRFNQPFDEIGQKNVGHPVTSLAKFWGDLGGSRGSFGLKCSPRIADWSLKVIWKCQHMKKFARNKETRTKTESNLGQNMPKLAQICRYTWNKNCALT